MSILREGLRLGAIQALLLWACTGSPVVQALLVGWAAMMWSAGLWVHAPVGWRATLASAWVASAIALGAAAPLDALSPWLLLAIAIGVGVGRVRLLPSAASEAGSAEAWARAHREEYRGRGTGRKPVDTVTHDPYGGILGTARRETAPERDPYEDALTVPFESGGPLSDVPEGLSVDEDLHRVRVALRSGTDWLLVALGTGFGLVVAGLILGQMGSVWPLAAVLVATAVLMPSRRSSMSIDSDTLEVVRVELGRRVTHRLPLHAVTEVEADGSTLRLDGETPLVITGVDNGAASWLADRIRAAADIAVPAPPEAPVPEALRQITRRAPES